MSKSTIQDALSASISGYISDHPKSRAIYEASLKYLPGANTRSVLHASPFPLAFERGEGEKLWDADGWEFIDLLGEFTAGILGHRHPEIQKEIEEAAKDGWSFGSVNIWEGKLAEKVCTRWGLESVRFTNSGTEANLMAIGAAKVFTGRQKIIVFHNGYHGSVLSFKHPISPINVPHDFLVLPYNDEDAIKSAVSSLPQASLAAILVEPMQGSGGCIPPRKGFLELLRRICNEQKALLIFDEVMTSRMRLGGMQAALEIKPDLTTLGKYVGGGFSFGAFGGKTDIMGLFDPRKELDGIPHSGTFNNNVFSMRAGIKALDILTEGVLDDLYKRGTRLREALNAVFKKENLGSRCEVTGLGSLMNVHFYTKGKENEKKEDTQLMDLFWFYLLEQGVYIARRGFIALTIVHDDQSVDGLIRVTETFVKDFKQFLA